MPENHDEKQLAAGVESVPPILLELTGPEAACVVAQLQLALRHPANKGNSSQIAAAVANTLISAFPPEVRRLLDKGFDPQHDKLPSPEVLGGVVVRGLLRPAGADVQWPLFSVEGRGWIVGVYSTGAMIGFDVGGRHFHLGLHAICEQLIARIRSPIHIGGSDGGQERRNGHVA